MKKLIMLMSTIALLSAHQTFSQCKVIVSVEGVRHNKGTVYVALQNNAEVFKRRDKYYMMIPINLDKNVTSCTFENIDPGTYAVSLFHDENNDGKPNFNFIGLPKEGFGFSNNAMGVMKEPSFKAASFTVTTDKTAIQKIKLRYIL